MFLNDYIQFTECFDKKITILSPPQRTVSCENSICPMEAVAQFSYSHRYKKRAKFFGGFQIYLNHPNSPFTLSYQKQSFFPFFVEFNFDKNCIGIWGGAFSFFIQPKVWTNLWKIDFGNSPWLNFLAIDPYIVLWNDWWICSRVSYIEFCMHRGEL